MYTYIYIYIYIWFLGYSFLIYCYIVHPGSYLENKDNHQTKHKKNGIFKESGTLYFGVILQKKTTFSWHFKTSSSGKWMHIFPRLMLSMLHSC